MLATFTVSETLNEDFELDGWCFPTELFKHLKAGVFDAFRVDFIDGKFSVTISGDNKDEDITAFLVAYADGPDSVEYHISP